MLCRKIGIPVISPREVDESNIDEILISSFDHRKEWKEESLKYKNITVVELYEYLEQNNIFCTTEFYNLEYITQDYDNMVYLQSNKMAGNN